MQDVMTQLAAGQLTPVTVVVWTLLALVLGVAGGVLGGLKMGGKEIGHDLAAMMGALFGPSAVAPAVFCALLYLLWMQG